MKRLNAGPLIVVPLALMATTVLGRRAAPDRERRVSRGGLLALGGLGVVACATAGWRSRRALAAGYGVSSAPRVPAVTAAAASCVLTPEQTAGPYYIPKEKVRSDIAERKPGAPLTLRLIVLDATTCTPLKGASVDIWHCDAAGVYSGFEEASAGGVPGSGAPTDQDTFLRGIQRTDARGACVFQTIYPGWYRGRTTHIHVSVHLGGTTVHTGQLYFSDALSDTIYRTGAYRKRPARDTRNSNDGIYAHGGAQSTLSVTSLGNGRHAASMTVGVRRA